VVRLACERPDMLGRSLSQWDCHELARQLIAEGIVEDISASTVRRILAVHQLKPWRHHLWLHPKQPRDATFYATIMELIDLYTRPLRDDEMVLSVDEKTSLQPRPRLAPTLPAQPQNIPNRHEHEYKRAGALNLFAAFDTRSGQVYGHCYERKRQQECIAFLEALDQEIAAHIRTIHLVCDNVSTHHGKEVTRWFAKHPRFVVHFTPVHCSWMNQVEQWLSCNVSVYALLILHRKTTCARSLTNSSVNGMSRRIPSTGPRSPWPRSWPRRLPWQPDIWILNRDKLYLESPSHTQNNVVFGDISQSERGLVVNKGGFTATKDRGQRHTQVEKIPVGVVRCERDRDVLRIIDVVRVHGSTIVQILMHPFEEELRDQHGQGRADGIGDLAPQSGLQRLDALIVVGEPQTRPRA
jgi:hypothetical protein